MRKLTDRYGRLHDYLRISLTDKSNLNSSYSDMLNKARNGSKKKGTLSAEELCRIVRLFTEEFGFKKVRFAGGEPFVRKDIMEVLEQIKVLREKNNFNLAITTNGTLLFDKLAKLKQYGVTLLNINLDTLDRKKFQKINGKDKFLDVMNSVDVAMNYGFEKIKINCVVVKGINDDEIPHFAAFAYLKNINVRFIEYSLNGSNGYNEADFIPVNEIRNIVGRKHNLSLIEESRNTVAESYRILGSKGIVSFISAAADNYCDSCNRVRITSDGHLKLCLYSKKTSELDLKPLLRDSKYTDSDICKMIEGIIRIKKPHHPPVEEIIQLKINNKITIGN